MRFPRPALVALLLALSTAGLVAQGVIMGRPGRIGPRDNVAPKTGTSRLRGRVGGGESGQPLRRAVVMLSGQELGEGRVASTDEEGRWELKDLPAGRYQLHASKGGFVQLAYGQRRPFEQGRPIELAEGQTLENVNFNLPRGSVITGRIVDEYGEPIAEATVTVMRYRYMNGRRRMIPAGRFAQSDDIGSFRLFGLAPGAYYVSATMRPTGMMGMNAGEGGTSYAPTYYPGTGSAPQAEAINVGLGAEVSGITFALQPVRTVKVSGTAVDSTGKPMAGAFVMLREDMRSGDGGMMMMWGGGNRVRDDGTFELSNVTPGDYILEARPMMMGPPRRGDGDPEAAFASVSVGGEDVTGVALMGTRGTSIRGHVVMQPAAAVGGVKPSEISVNAMAKNADAPMLFMGGEMRDRLEDDWTFELKAVQSPVLIRSFRLPPGYTLKSVTLNGVDVTDSGIAFKTNEPITGVQVVLSNTSTTVTGTVTDDTGRAAPDYAVVLFAEDNDQWGFMSRYIKLARPDQQGGYQVKDLPPGRYLGVAVETIESGEETDPALLERMRSLATPFTLNDGEQRALNLKLVRGY